RPAVRAGAADRAADRHRLAAPADELRVLQRHKPSAGLSGMPVALRLPGPVRVMLFALLAAGLLFAGSRAVAQDEAVVVRDIRVEGLQRISEGTVFNYLPVNIGDRLDPARIREATRAVYGTGFFRDVEIRWDNGVLVV